MLTMETARACGYKEMGKYDLAVVGAGPAGIGAALAAARQGLRVALVESCGFPGGVGTQACVPLFFGFGVAAPCPNFCPSADGPLPRRCNCSPR